MANSGKADMDVRYFAAGMNFCFAIHNSDLVFHSSHRGPQPALRLVAGVIVCLVKPERRAWEIGDDIAEADFADGGLRGLNRGDDRDDPHLRINQRLQRFLKPGRVVCAEPSWHRRIRDGVDVLLRRSPTADGGQVDAMRRARFLRDRSRTGRDVIGGLKKARLTSSFSCPFSYPFCLSSCPSWTCPLLLPPAACRPE